jgi:hypothetical protein
LGASRLAPEDNPIHHRFLAHAAEEKDHQLLARGDLEALGLALEQFPEMALTAAFYQTQYYRIEYQHPVAFFGYVLLLEGMAVRMGSEMYDEALRHHGPGTTTFFELHNKSDPDHFPQALANVAMLSQAQQQLVKDNLRFTADLFGDLVAKIAAGANA